MANAGGAAPALVSDEEDVARLCFRAGFPITRRNSHHSDVDPESGFYRLEEFTWDDFTNRGFSVQRLALFSRDAANAAYQAKVEKRRAKGDPVDTLEFLGAVVASVAQIHAIRTAKGGRAFAVCQEPIEGNPAHACIRSDEQYSKPEFMKYRLLLQAIFAQVRGSEVFPESSTDSPSAPENSG